MKRIILLLGIVVLVKSMAFAQDMQYVSRQSGDTLWVKDNFEFDGSNGFSGDNTLSNLMRSDSLAPATRVYFLNAGGVYGCANNPSSSSKYRTIIMGPEQNLKTGSPTMQPPIISGPLGETMVGTYGGMTINKDLLVKNVDLEIGNPSGNNGGWAFFNFSGPNMRLQVENCIMEHTWWTWVGGPPAMSVVKFTNDYFVNLDGHSCRNNGGVVDFNSGSAFQQDTLLVENCTHVNTQGTLYKFRTGYTVDRAIFNHNNFIDCAGYIIMNNGDQTNLSVTNNIYVNCQLQAYYVPYGVWDVGPGPDTAGMGLVNLRVDSSFTANVGTHGVYVDKNVTYWDPSLSDIVSTLNTNHINGDTNWLSQMITMNTRTEALFAEKTTYPLLTNGKWISKKPTFANTDVLFGTQLAVLKAYAIACVDTGYKSPLTSWRQPSNPEASNFVHADWPIPIDLSYTDADLLTAGLGGFPIGDLGWFPTQYAAWKAQESAELANIQNVLDNGGGSDAIRTTEQLPQEFQLGQNYPNPFNPATLIEYSIPKTTFASIQIYDILGREVTQLVNEMKQPGIYSVRFNGGHLPSGIYFYAIHAGDFHQVRKMLLIK
jgi:hypothetical protein